MAKSNIMKISKSILHNENRHSSSLNSELKTMQIKLTSHPGGVSGTFFLIGKR